MATFNLNILPIHRYNGQESAELPGLLALTPPRKTARGRERDAFLAYLMLAGNPSIEASALRTWISEAGNRFYQAHGPLTSAMRKAADQINSKLLEHNRAATSQSDYALGILILAVIRDSQCTLLLSGPAHAVWVSDGKSRYIHEPALSGKGLGVSQSPSIYLSQVELHPQDLLALCGIFPRDWEADLLNERPPASLESSYRKLTFAKGDLNAVLVQAQSGHGVITILQPDLSSARHSIHRADPAPARETIPESQPQEAQPDAEEDAQSSAPAEPAAEPVSPQPVISEEKLDALADLAAHYVQPSAYAIPPQSAGSSPPSTQTAPVTTGGGRAFPSSIPRAKPVEHHVVGQPEVVEAGPPPQPEEPAWRSRRRRSRSAAPTAAARQVAKAMVGGIQTWRRVKERLGGWLQSFLPRLLPGSEVKQPYSLPTYALIFIAVVIPVTVVTVASVVYLRFGQSIQYDELFVQARNAQEQAISEADPIHQRDAWLRVLAHLDAAEEYRQTDESQQLRAEAQFQLDILMGISRLEFFPAFSRGLGGSVQISRMAASESDLYMLNAEDGRILHATLAGNTLEMDTAFRCEPGTHGGYQVGTLIDLVALPKVNALGAAVMGIDASGTLLYCAPDQVPQAIPLPSLPNTRWGSITAIALDSGNLYILDAPSRAVWVFVGKDSSFLDTPYFYFGNEIPANIESANDLTVNGDDLYMLHDDGHLSTCTFSRLSEVPTRCQDPAPRVDNYPAHRDLDIFQQADFTQLGITSPPNSVLLLLDSANRSVFRFSPRSFELQTQVTGFAGEANPFEEGPARAMAVSPNYVLYLAIGDQVYFTTSMP